MPIKRVLSLFFFAALCGCSVNEASLRRGKDIYPDLAALRAANVAGRDYSVEAYDRAAPVTVFAIHGGDIELGTSRLARRLADKDLNLYIFNGWLGRESGRLHVTAAHFDDPAAVRLATSSVLGISLHAQADRGSYVCVGGKNEEAARMVSMRLEAAGFAAETPCLRLRGSSDNNIVNRSSAGGVQLEITLRLLHSLEKSPEDSARFTDALRLAMFESVQKIQQGSMTK
ncbi:MAG: poly-gamma-glutamate hydrolase family protein [Elusimicrobiota bacterium]